MIASHEATYQRLVVRTRESVRATIQKNLVAERAYNGSSGGNYFEENAGMREKHQQYQAASVGWQRAAINVTSVSIANQPVRVGIQGDKRPNKKQAILNKSLSLNAPAKIKALVEDVEILNVHPIVDLLERPNPKMCGWSHKYSTAFSLEATGEAYWWRVKNPEHTSGYNVYYLPATWVSAAISKETGRQVGWIIKTPGQTEGFPVRLNEILRFYYPNPSHPGEPFSPTQAQAKAINTDDQIQTAQYRAMVNGIFPGMVIIAGTVKDGNGQEHPVELSPDQRQELLTSIQSTMGGALHYNDPIIVDAMIKDVKPYTNSPSEMAFLEGSQLTEKRIAAGYGVNPIVMGQIESANRASSFVAHEGFYRTKVNPILTLIGETLTQFMGPLFNAGDRLYVWFDEAQPRDADLHLRQIQSAATFGCLTKNEFREAIGLAPITGGDKLIEPVKMAPKGRGRPPST